MSAGATERLFVLRGAAEALAAALDALHLHCSVRGVVERDDCLEIALVGTLPELDGVTVEVRAPESGAVTGLEHDAPIQVADDLLVRPPWVPGPPGFSGIELVVPRGSAFGSGEAGSTQAALLALHATWPAARPVGLADVGTGSGILALYGRLRGADPLLACDVDPVAVRAARELLQGADVRVGGPADLPRGVADVVVANLDQRELRAACAAILGLWTRRGPLILGGLRAPELAEFAEAVRPATELCRFTRDGYVGVAFRGA